MSENTDTRHPFDGERFDRARRIRFWDDIAYDYEGRIMQGDIPLQIVDYLQNNGYIDNDTDGIEFGCGPGTYSTVLAPVLRELVCVDTSEKMLNILSHRCDELGIDNIRMIKQDFDEMIPDRRYDLSIATLCPGSGSQEALKRMSDFAEKVCVHVMWIENTWDNLHAKVWEKLGKNYSFEERKRTIVPDNLKAMGYEPDVLEFNGEVHWELPVDELMSREKRTFYIYDQNIDPESELREVLCDYIDGDRFSIDCTNSMRVVIWDPESGS